MSDPSDRLINLFGALAVGVMDRVRAAAVDETALGGETAAAVVVIGHEPGLTIDRLGRVLGLSHPGTVRLVDRLARAGLAARGAAPHDRRSVALRLTDPGQAERARMIDRRRNALTEILAAVAPADRAAVERAAEAVLRTLPHDANTALTICRFCDQRNCDHCPMDVFYGDE